MGQARTCMHSIRVMNCSSRLLALELAFLMQKWFMNDNYFELGRYWWKPSGLSCLKSSSSSFMERVLRPPVCTLTRQLLPQCYIAHRKQAKSLWDWRGNAHGARDVHAEYHEGRVRVGLYGWWRFDQVLLRNP